jgi:hypothetical protein
MFKDLIKLLMNFVYSIKDSIEKQLSLKVYFRLIHKNWKTRDAIEL